MYGYEPPKNDPPPGSWRDIFAIIRVVFMELAKPLAAIFGVLALVIVTVLLLFSDPVWAIIPVALLAFGGYLLYRRDQRNIREAEENLPR